jgi:hypothetical protein
MQILKYNRSRFHRYLISCKNYQAKEGSCFPKVGRFFTRKPTKLSLYFSVFSSIFYGFYKFQQKGFTIEDLTFKCSWKQKEPHNVVWDGWQLSGLNSGELASAQDQERTGKSSRITWGSICAGIGDRGGSGELARRWLVIAAAGQQILARRPARLASYPTTN